MALGTYNHRGHPWGGGALNKMYQYFLEGFFKGGAQIFLFWVLTRANCAPPLLHKCSSTPLLQCCVVRLNSYAFPE